MYMYYYYHEYMSEMSRSRQRVCLAQRGKRRVGGQKSSVCNYVAEMGNNLWPRKYPAFAKLEAIKQKQFWIRQARRLADLGPRLRELEIIPDLVQTYA